MTRQSAANAKEAKGLAEASRTGAMRGVESMQRLAGAADRITAGASATAKIVKTIDEIAFQTNLLLTTAVDQMNSAMQQTAASSEKSAGAAEEPSGQSGRLQELVAHFKLSNATRSEAPLRAKTGTPRSRPSARFATRAVNARSVSAARRYSWLAATTDCAN